MSKIEAVIFDWAGTTIDYGCFAPLWALAESFKLYGIIPTMDEIRQYMGMAKRDHIRAMLGQERISKEWMSMYHRMFTEEDVENIYAQCERMLLSTLGEYSTPKPFVVECVRELRQHGIKIGSTTGYNDEMMKIVVPKAAKAGYSPDAWVSPDSTNKLGRPYPYMIYENMKKLKIISASGVMKIGDSITDIMEGKNAGVISVGVVEGSSLAALSETEFKGLRTEEQVNIKNRVRSIFLENGADYVIDNMSQLCNLIKTIEKN